MKGQMKKAELLKACPCGTGVNYESCCQPYLLGLEKPDTAEKLLRSRYTAFVVGQPEYIFETLHPDKIKEVDKQGIIDWSKKSQWHSLEILSTEDGKAKDEEGIVEFVAKYTQEGKTYNHHEISLFKKYEDRWTFFDVKKNRPVKTERQIGRNEPCFCGSGKKFKKCHGMAA